MAKKIFKILSIDGGGIRGVIPASFMVEIERRTGQPIAELFDLIAGTSTGGILALGVAMPGEGGHPRYTARDSISLYEEHGAAIFQQSLRQTISTGANLLGEKYPAAPMEAVLERYFGDVRFKDALTDLLITAYDIERRIPWFFRSIRAQARSDYDFPMKFVARATSAAPTYFETAKVSAEDSSDYYALIDGGVFASNPAMCAYADAVRNYSGYDDYLVVSLGTGQYTRPIPYNQAKDWGMIGWVRPVIDILTHGVSESVDYQLQGVLPPLADGTQRYYRFQVKLDPFTDKMDNVSPQNIRALRLMADDLIRRSEADFERVCGQLMDGQS